MQKRMKSGLRVIILQGAIENSPILLQQYWKFKCLGFKQLSHQIKVGYIVDLNDIFKTVFSQLIRMTIDSSTQRNIIKLWKQYTQSLTELKNTGEAGQINLQERTLDRTSFFYNLSNCFVSPLFISTSKDNLRGKEN